MILVGNRSSKRFATVFILVAILIVGICGAIIYLSVSSHYNAGVKEVNRLGLNDTLKVRIGDARTTSEINGDLALTFGSIRTKNESLVRISLSLKDGNSYIVDVPLTKIKFVQKKSTPGGATANFNIDVEGSNHQGPWKVNKPLQENLDNNLRRITINVTSEEYTKLFKK